MGFKHPPHTFLKITLYEVKHFYVDLIQCLIFSTILVKFPPDGEV